MKKYSILHVPALSFFSPSLYHDVCAHWKGTGFGYLLLLLAVCWIPAILQMQVGLSNFINNEAPKIVSQIPRITFMNGEASVEGEQPCTIRDPKTGQAIVVIDTTGSMTSLQGTDAIGLVTKTEATFKKNAVETRTFAFKEIKEFTLDRDMITGWMAKAKTFVAPVVYPFAVLGSFVGRVLQILIYAAIGLILASWCNTRRTYTELLRLTVVALTPCIIVQTVLGIVQIRVPVPGLLYFLAAMGYLLFGIKAAAAGERAGASSSTSAIPPEYRD
jgi:hypothetical protein